jgi:DNA-binding NtrC family response regulator
MDMEELRREFEVYRARHQDGGPAALPAAGGTGADYPALAAAPPAAPAETPPDEREEGTIVFRPGMTMQEMEREAIGAALLHSRGNRRRAAEMLGIGERTLYRKLKEYQIEA